MTYGIELNKDNTLKSVYGIAKVKEIKQHGLIKASIMYQQNKKGGK